MLKKIYNLTVPEFVKRQIREKSPYYQRFQELSQKYEDLSAANQAQQKDAGNALKAKEDELARWIATSREQQRQLSAKDETISRWNAVCQEQQEQLQAKDETIARLTAESQRLLAQLQTKEDEFEHLTVENQAKTHAAFETYQSSLRQIFQNPSIREDHLCSICGSLMQYNFSRRIMNKYDVSYFYCPHCDHIQTEKPYWLEESYQSPLSDSDTGQIWRNERNCTFACAALQRFFPPSAKVLEYAGGYGLLTRMLRDAGAECFWYDKYAENTFARHFEDDGKQKYDLVLAFEALEHFENPMLELENIFNSGNSLLFSEVLLTEPCPAQWWYLCTEHGQHVNFYSRKTFQYIAEHFHKNLYFHEDIGLMTSCEINEDEFVKALEQAEGYAKKFRENHRSLREQDMNTIIEKMKQP